MWTTERVNIFISIFVNWDGFTVLIGFSIYPNIPVRNVDLCIVKLLIITEHEFSELFDKISMEEKYRSNFNRERISGISARIVSSFSAQSNEIFDFFKEKCKIGFNVGWILEI